MPSIKVLIIEYYPLLRKALKTILASEDDIAIVGDTASVEEAMDIVARHNPDIVFTSFIQPNSFNYGKIKKARRLNPSIKIIAFVIGRSAEVQRALFDINVSGLLRIDAGVDTVRLTLRRVIMGEKHIDPKITDTLFDRESEFKELRLSYRQLQVLRMIADGFTNKRISAELGISQDTVKTHVRAILKKLGAVDRAQAVSKAYELGVLCYVGESNTETGLDVINCL